MRRVGSKAQNKKLVLKASILIRACHGPTLVGRPGVGPGRARRPGLSFFDMMGRGPARPVNCSENGLRPGPAHQFFRGWNAARPSP